MTIQASAPLVLISDSHARTLGSLTWPAIMWAVASPLTSPRDVAQGGRAGGAKLDLGNDADVSVDDYELTTSQLSHT